MTCDSPGVAHLVNGGKSGAGLPAASPEWETLLHFLLATSLPEKNQETEGTSQGGTSHTLLGIL